MKDDQEVQSKILTVVAQRFVGLKEATTRKVLNVQFESPAAISDLVNRTLLRQMYRDNDQEYLPNAATFEFCDDRQLRDNAKLGTTVVAHALKNIYRVETSKQDFTFDDVLEHVRRIFPGKSFEDRTLKLGLYLSQYLNVLGSCRENPPANTEIVSFRVGEGILAYKDIDSAWDAGMSGYKAKPIFAQHSAAQAKTAPHKIQRREQTFLPAQSQHDAYVQLRNIVKSTRRELFIVDSYVDYTLWELLTNVNSKATIRILTDKMQGDFQLEGRKFIAQHGNAIEVRKTKTYHDRFIICDGECWHIGASIKDAGNKAFAFSKMFEPANVKSIVNDIEAKWLTAIPVGL